MLHVAENETEALLAALDEGRALPSNWYTDEAHFARERDRVLRRSWHYAGHTGQLSRPGDHVLVEIAGIPFILLRDDTGELRAFVNICRHRAHAVCLEPGNRKTLQCLYHGWTYRLDGRLHRAPRAENELEFDPAQFSLVPGQVAQWGPTIWINPDPEAPSFDIWLHGLKDLVAEHGIDVDRYAFALERSWTIEANWKVFLDNAIECYHCPTCHPGLSQVIETDPDLHVTTTAGPYRISSETPFRDGVWQQYYGIEEPLADGREPRYHFHWVFPTTYFQYKSAADFELGTIGIRGVDQLEFRHLVFMRVDASEEALAQRREKIKVNPTVDEDIAICERVQAAHRAGVTPAGRLLPRSEEALLHFQRTILEMTGPGFEF